jgi:hypothetical protein
LRGRREEKRKGYKEGLKMKGVQIEEWKEGGKVIRRYGIQLEGRGRFKCIGFPIV